MNSLLNNYLREGSIMEILQRQQLFEALIDLCNLCSHTPDLIFVLQPSLHANFRGSVDVMPKLREIGKQIELYLKGSENFDKAEAEAVGVIHFFNIAIKTIDLNQANTIDVIQGEIEYKEIENNSNNYEQWMKSKQFDVIDLSEESFYYSKVRPAMSKEKLKRLKKDIAILSNSLPEGVFVRIDENHMDIIKVMIVGPRGTPYENGCFFFDLSIPENYPQQNPEMIFLTTGNHMYRFNPNLYNEGKICLSLLGTWSGPGWDPETSTLLQLLVSIQALVFVDYPLENEPGYEGQALSTDSLSYNKGLCRGTTLYAMLYHFTGEDPTMPQCFKEITNAFFYQNQERIKQTIAKWDQDYELVTDFCSYFSWDSSLTNSWEATKESLFANFAALPEPTYE